MEGIDNDFICCWDWPLDPRDLTRAHLGWRVEQMPDCSRVRSRRR
jgi:hypothetical protein